MAEQPNPSRVSVAIHNLETWSENLVAGFDPDDADKYTETIRLINDLIEELSEHVKVYNHIPNVDTLREGLRRTAGLVNITTVNLTTLKDAASTIRDNLDIQKQNKLELEDARDRLKELNGQTGDLRDQCEEADECYLAGGEKFLLREIEDIIDTVVLLTHRLALQAGGSEDFTFDF